MRAAIYARQSLDREKIENETTEERKQRQSDAIQKQVDICRKLLHQKEWEGLAPYTDNDVSASKSRAKNTAWSRLLVDIEAGKIDVVVSVDLDRLLRSTSDLVVLLATGVKVMTVDGEIDLTTADGEFRATILTGIARFEVRRKSERQKRENVDRIKRGKPIPGRRRFGYETDGLTPRPEEAILVIGLFDRFLANASIRSLAIGMGWRNERVRATLSNPAYWGLLRSKGVEYEAPGLTPLIDPAVAALVQTKLKDPTRRVTPGPVPKHLASGIAVCGVCGATMFYMRSYRCREDASHPSITKSILDPLIAKRIAFAMMTMPRSTFDKGESTSGLFTSLNDNLAAQERYLGLIDRGVTVTKAEARLVALEKEETQLRSDIDTARAKTSTARLLADLRGNLWHGRTVSFDQAIETRYAIATAFLDADLEAQRELLRGMFTVTVNPGRVAATRVVFVEKYPVANQSD